MAKLKANGVEVGRVDHLVTQWSFRSNGKVLQWKNGEWKHYGKIKTGFTPESAFKETQLEVARYEDKHPAYAAYKRSLHRNVGGWESRVMANTFVKLMPGDPDGVYSDCNDAGIHITVPEAVELCEARLMLNKERQDFKQTRSDI